MPRGFRCRTRVPGTSTPHWISSSDSNGASVIHDRSSVYGRRCVFFTSSKQNETSSTSTVKKKSGIASFFKVGIKGILNFFFLHSKRLHHKIHAENIFLDF